MIRTLIALAVESVYSRGLRDQSERMRGEGGKIDGVWNRRTMFSKLAK